MEKIDNKFSHIPGWGVDANPYNEPTYPIKNYTGDDHNRLDYERAPQQQTDLEILQSTERPALTAVFGTSTPPSGLSGLIRRWAYTKSEGRYSHWLPLLLADRINVVEGVVSDLFHLHIPNYFSERGFKADWKYNRKGVIRKVVIGTLLTTAAIVLLSRKKKRE